MALADIWGFETYNYGEMTVVEPHEQVGKICGVDTHLSWKFTQPSRLRGNRHGGGGVWVFAPNFRKTFS